MCLKIIYSNERPLLGSEGALIRERALIKKFSFKQIRYPLQLTAEEANKLDHLAN